ncbi:hypothetical protein DFJ74DRAFT_708518 [Hyaloraphidium curvatum]|nr:hypothetical protein DFJ74DRAFT_708518 [Hyaloraphidium curvatum]
MRAKWRSEAWNALRVTAILAAVGLLALYTSLSASPQVRKDTFHAAERVFRPHAIRPAETNPPNAEDYAARTLAENLRRVGPCLARVAAAAAVRNSTAGAGAGTPGCMSLFDVGPGGAEIRASTAGCEIEGRRACAVLAVIRGLFDGNPPRLHVSRNFSFWLSTADSTILSTEQYDDLGLPTLVPGKPETDVCGIPVPESYAVFALVGSDPDLHAGLQRMCPKASDTGGPITFQADLFRSFPSLAEVPWDSKQNKAVFVARCYSTYTVDNVTLTAKPFPTRGYVCREAWSAPNRADLDVGLLVEPALLTGANKTCAPDGPGDLCRMCLPCRRKRLLDRPEQARGYRFQVAVDGYGPTWDAIYWKLASNSTVFAVQHQGGVRYAQWFGPLLEEGANYIATTARDLPRAVAACVRDPERCRRIAMAAARTFRAAFDLGQIERYWTLLLQKLHDGDLAGEPP